MPRATDTLITRRRAGAVASLAASCGSRGAGEGAPKPGGRTENGKDPARPDAKHRIRRCLTLVTH